MNGAFRIVPSCRAVAWCFFASPVFGERKFLQTGSLPHRYLLMVSMLSRVFFCAAPVELTPPADRSSSPPWPRSVPFSPLTAAVCQRAGSWAGCALCCGTEGFRGSAQTAAGARRARTDGFCCCSLVAEPSGGRRKRGSRWTHLPRPRRRWNCVDPAGPVAVDSPRFSPWLCAQREEQRCVRCRELRVF